MLLAIAAPPLAAVALEFGAPEYFALIVLGLLVSISLAHGSVLKALGMIIVGLLLGTVGQDIYTGEERFTFGYLELSQGINFVSIAVGVFGVAEIFRNLQHEYTREVGVNKVTNLWLSKQDFRRIAGPVLRGTALGSIWASSPAADMCSPRSPAILRKRTSPRRRKSSVMAQSKAWPVQKAPITLPPRRRSSRYSLSASLHIPSWP